MELINANTNSERQTPSPSPVTADLPGTVLDQNERPFEGAKVTIDDLPGMMAVETSADEVFSVSRIPREYGDGLRIQIVEEGYTPYTEMLFLGRRYYE